MTDPVQWRDRQQAFRTILNECRDSLTLRAYRLGPQEFQLSDRVKNEVESDLLRGRFRATAATAGVLLGMSGDPFQLWLMAVVERSPRSKKSVITSTVLGEDASCECVEIPFVMLASIEVCEKFEMHAFVAEKSSRRTSSGRESSLTVLGRNLNELRKECGWTIEALAQHIGANKSNVIDHLHGKRRPRPSTLKNYATAFSKRLDQNITVQKLEG